MDIFYVVAVVLTFGGLYGVWRKYEEEMGYASFVAAYLTVFYKQVFLDGHPVIAFANLAFVASLTMLVRQVRRSDGDMSAE